VRTEQQVLKLSLVGVLVVSTLGISFGLFSGSFAILFDGVFSLVDAVMSIISITLAGLIAKSANNSLSRRTKDRFTMGFWHFEPIVLAVNALLMMSVATYALFQAVSALLAGGRDVEFGPAVIYAAVVVVLTAIIGFIESRANKKIQSDLVSIDVKGWLMAGGVTSALLIAFIIGALIDGTDASWLMPYVDPAVLALVALVLIPVPFSTLRKSVAEIALVTPPELKSEADAVATSLVEAQGFSDARVYVSQQGRARTVDIVFYVPRGDPPKALEEWDDLRDSVLTELNGEDPHSWITISFTTKTPPALPSR
jgi:predicted Co/Zn/Cd cation transporter (cation efflux family)